MQSRTSAIGSERVTNLETVKWIRQLDENGAVDLARQLIFAEAGRHSLPLGAFTMSGRVKVADQGIDGRTAFPQGTDTLWPKGPCVWQVKSGPTRPSAATEFDEEKHARLIQAIRDGSDYVLFWTNDPIDDKGESVGNAFRDAVKAVRSDAVVHLLFSEDIERMCNAHLGLLARLSPLRVRGLIGLDGWAQDHDQVPFQADPSRTEFLQAIRRHVQSDTGAADLHVLGDTGVGKSRLVYEALTAEGIKERVLIAPDALGFDRGLLAEVVASPGQSLVLVVDDCEAEARRQFANTAGLARGRIRLVTIGSRTSRERSPSDSRFLEVLPLGAEASKQIAASIGLGETDAALVARHTEGYPGLARDLAKAMLYGSASTSIAERVRGHDELGSVLAKLVPTDAVGPLGMLALFERLGYDEDLGQELSVACEILGADEAQVRFIADRELGKLVSTAGRYRRVSPRLLAIWLATRYLDEHGDSLQSALKELPEGLRDQILDQMRDVGDDARVQRALRPLLETHPFLSGALADVDEGAARLLHVGAIVTPEATMGAITRVLEGADTDALSDFGAGRRDMVWALQLLLWDRSTFSEAASALLRLAMAENESWSNNATGAVKGAFGIFLGGTTAPFSHRLEWAREALAVHAEGCIDVLVPALGHALTAHESRMAPDFGGRNAPEEWRPRSLDEERDAREGAWSLLLEIAATSVASRESVADALSSGIRTLLQRGSADRVLREILTVAWSASARGKLAESLRHALEYDEPPAELAHQIQDLVDSLEGGNLDDQIDFVIAQSPWQLTEKRDELIDGRPKLVLSVAEALLELDDRHLIDVSRRTLTANPETTSILFEAIGAGLTAEEALHHLASERPIPDAALLGLFIGMSQSRSQEWAVETLFTWLKSDLRRLVIPAVHRLPASVQTLQLALDSVSRSTPPIDLTRFLYGAWAQPLSPSAVELLIRTLVTDPGERALEHGLGILEQWIEGHDRQIPSELVDLANELVAASNKLSDKASSMLELYRGRILDALPLDYDSRLAGLLVRMQALDTLPRQGDLEELDLLLTVDGPGTTNAVVRLFVQSLSDGTFQGWLTWIDSANVLSRLGRGAGYATLIDVITAQAAPDLWPRLLAHIDFNGETPDPLFVHLLENAATDEFADTAMYRFEYPESTWWGGDSERIRQRIVAAKSWLAVASEPGTTLHNWLQQVLLMLEERLPEVIAREEERGY